MKYPARYSNRAVACRNRNEVGSYRGNNVDIGTQVLHKMFSTTTSRHHINNGRTHCQSIQNTAILIDRNGNKVVLKQHQTIFNVDKDTRGIAFEDHGRAFRKNHH